MVLTLMWLATTGTSDEWGPWAVAGVALVGLVAAVPNPLSVTGRRARNYGSNRP